MRDPLRMGPAGLPPGGRSVAAPVDMPTTRSSPVASSKTTAPTALQRRHLGFSIRKYRELPTSDGVAYSCEITLNGKVVGNAENHGNGGGAFVYFMGRDMEQTFLQLSRLSDSNGTHRAETTEDIALLLISTAENERSSKKKTVLRSEPVEDDLDLRVTFEMTGRVTAEQLRRRPIVTDPVCTQVWEPGEGWVVITTGETFD